MSLKDLPKEDRPDIGHDLDRKDIENPDSKDNQRVGGDPSIPGVQDPFSADGIKNAEESGDGSRGMYNGSSGDDNEDNGGGLYSDNRSDKKKRGRFGITRKQTAIGSGITGLVISAVFGGMSIFQGPIGVVHYGEVLLKALTGQEEATNSRFQGLIRLARTGEIGETRVGFVGSRIAAKTRESLKNAGYEVTKRHPITGRPEQITIDTSKYRGLRGARNEAAAEKFLKDYAGRGLDADRIALDPKADSQGGNIRLNVAGRPALARAIENDGISTIHEDKRTGKLITAVSSRATMNYNGTYLKLLHPFKSLRLGTQEAVFNWLRDRNKSLTQRPAIPNARVQKAKDKIKPFSTAIGTTLGVQMTACVAKEITGDIAYLNYENTFAVAEKSAIDAIAISSNTKTGRLHASEAGAIFKNFTNEKGESVFSSPAFKALSRQSGSKNRDLDADIKKAMAPDNTAAGIEKTINDFGGSIACSTPGIIGGVALGGLAIFAAAPTGGASLVAFGVGIGASAAATSASIAALTTYLPKILTDEPLNNTPHSGPTGGNVDAIGAREFNNDTYRKLGGVEMADSESTEINDALAKKEDLEFRSKSFASRLFDTTDYRSAVSRVAVSMPSTPRQIASGFKLSSITSVFSNLFSVFMPRSMAADSGRYDWGFPEYGFSRAELNNPLFEDPYDNADKAVVILNADSAGGYIKRARQCFGVDIAKDGNGRWGVKVADVPEGDTEKQVVPATAKYQEADCKDGSDEWLRIRFFIFDSRTMDSYACYDGDGDACLQAGLNITSVAANNTEATSIAGSRVDMANVQEPSDSVDCAEGTKNIGLRDGYTEGRKVRIRLCEVSNIPQASGYGVSNGKASVNSRVSGAFYAMAEAAKKDGINLRAGSSFKSMAEQETLCNGNAGCSSGDYTLVAKPGTSNHQLGVAIDFMLGNAGINSGSCINVNGKCTLKGTPGWEWLDKNAGKFDLKQYIKEFWHWSPLEN